MKVNIALTKGKITSIGSVYWNDIASNAYVKKSSLKQYNDNYNKFLKDHIPDHEERSLDDFISNIIFAEIPFDIIDDNSEVIKHIGYGYDPDFN